MAATPSAVPMVSAMANAEVMVSAVATVNVVATPAVTNASGTTCPSAVPTADAVIKIQRGGETRP